MKVYIVFKAKAVYLFDPRFQQFLFPYSLIPVILCKPSFIMAEGCIVRCIHPLKASAKVNNVEVLTSGKVDLLDVRDGCMVQYRKRS